MTKKLKRVDQKDLRKSQIGVLVWLIVIGGLALLLSIGFALRNSRQSENQIPQNQTPKQSQNSTNPVQPDNNLNSQKTPNESQQQVKTTKVQMETTKGIIQMVIEDSKMPVSAANFNKLVSSNFYSDLIFHRVEDWVIQGGDPGLVGREQLKETIPLETHPDLTHKRGAVGMARTPDPNSATSQFYIVKKDTHQIDGQYAIFGNVVSGMDVVDQMEIGDKIISAKIIE